MHWTLRLCSGTTTSSIHIGLNGPVPADLPRPHAGEYCRTVPTHFRRTTSIYPNRPVATDLDGAIAVDNRTGVSADHHMLAAVDGHGGIAAHHNVPATDNSRLVPADAYRSSRAHRLLGYPHGEWRAHSACWRRSYAAPSTGPIRSSPSARHSSTSPRTRGAYARAPGPERARTRGERRPEPCRAPLLAHASWGTC